MNKFCIILLLLTSCASAPCKKFTTIKKVGGCFYGRYSGLTCSAVTEDGITVRDFRPFTEGQLYCVDW